MKQKPVLLSFANPPVTIFAGSPNPRQHASLMRGMDGAKFNTTAIKGLKVEVQSVCTAAKSGK